MSALVHLIYTSVQTHPLTAAEVARLIQQSRLSNKKNGVTGILLHVEDTFFQVLEGPLEAVEALYAKILTDPRHERITRIIFEPIARRYFDGSLMSLAILSPAELTQLIQDENPERRERLLDGLDEGRAKRLLRAFTDGRWRTHIGSAPSATVRT